MSRIALIANPAASGFSATSYREVARILAQTHVVDSIWPNDAGDARAAAKRSATDGCDVVVAMGGDGVVHQVANGLIGTQAALGIIPVGTTNVLARILDIPRKPARAAALVGSGNRIRMRVASITATSNGRATEHSALFAAGIGFDAEVIKLAEEAPFRKVTFGSIHYARSATRVARKDFAGRAPTLRVEADGKQADAVAAMLQVQDTFTFFGRLPMRLADRAPALMAAQRINFTRALRITLRLSFFRSLKSTRAVTVWEGVGPATIIAEPPAWFEADGELLGQADRLDIEPDAESIQVLAP